MAAEPFYIRVPKVVGVKLVGKRSPWVSAKDIILEMLRHFTVKGGVTQAFEYGGPGVKSLTVPERATITNMEQNSEPRHLFSRAMRRTFTFLKPRKERRAGFRLTPDRDANYDEIWEIDLGKLEP